MARLDVPTVEIESTAVQPVVQEALRRHESRDSEIRGKIVDIATLTSSDPFQNVNVEMELLTPESEQYVKRVVDAGDHANLIAVSVELPSGDVFIDLFSYSDDPDSKYDSINDLSYAVGVDVSSVHHLVGERVTARRENNRWRVSEHLEERAVPPTVTKKDLLTPLLIAGLPFPLGILAGFQIGISPYLTGVAGFFTALFLYSILLYLTLVGKRDHSFPGIIGRLHQPFYGTDEGHLPDGSGVSDIENGEFRRMITLADEDEHDNERVVLHNLAIVVDIPPLGEQTVPVPAPARSWSNTTAKHLVYHLASSVETLDRAPGKLVPLKRVGDEIRVDYDALSFDEPSRNLTFGEVAADQYVSYINKKFDAGVRDETYKQ